MTPHEGAEKRETRSGPGCEPSSRLASDPTTLGWRMGVPIYSFLVARGCRRVGTWRFASGYGARREACWVQASRFNPHLATPGPCDSGFLPSLHCFRRGDPKPSPHRRRLPLCHDDPHAHEHPIPHCPPSGTPHRREPRRLRPEEAVGPSTLPLLLGLAITDPGTSPLGDASALLQADASASSSAGGEARPRPWYQDLQDRQLHLRDGQRDRAGRNGCHGRPKLIDCSTPHQYEVTGTGQSRHLHAEAFEAGFRRLATGAGESTSPHPRQKYRMAALTPSLIIPGPEATRCLLRPEPG